MTYHSNSFTLCSKSFKLCWSYPVIADIKPTHGVNHCNKEEVPVSIHRLRINRVRCHLTDSLNYENKSLWSEVTSPDDGMTLECIQFCIIISVWATELLLFNSTKVLLLTIHGAQTRTRTLARSLAHAQVAVSKRSPRWMSNSRQQKYNLLSTPTGNSPPVTAHTSELTNERWRAGRQAPPHHAAFCLSWSRQTAQSRSQRNDR